MAANDSDNNNNAITEAENETDPHELAGEPNDLDTISELNDLTFQYRDAGDLDKALECGEKAYELCSKVLGEEHPNTIACLNNLAINYKDLGDMDKALEHEHKAYELSVKVQGEEHQDTMDILFVLTNLYKDAGDIDKALEYGNKILSLLGEGHPDTQKASDWLQSFTEED